MTQCPDCAYDNIPGVDDCAGCGQSLQDLSHPEPTSNVEMRLITDKLKRLPPRQPLIVPPQMPVGQVLQLLVDHNVGCVTVCQDDRVIGIFSERDALVKINLDAAAMAARPISDFMTPNPTTLPDHAKIAFAVHQMDIGGFRHIPVVDSEGRCTGIVSVRDILDYLSALMAVEPV